MTVVQIPVAEDLILAMGQRAIEEFLQKQTQALRLQLLAERLDKLITDSGIDWDGELETARQEAWETYQRNHS
ncbi:MAG: hypothetical protein H7319_02850 [Spirosoma sp.]|nr:hypothetical protein [Spirosoma sp.]